MVGHLPDVVSAGEASDAGLRSVEHFEGVFVASSSREEELMRLNLAGKPQGGERAAMDSFSVSKAKALSARFQRNGTRMVPTLSNFWTRLGMARRDPEIVAADRLRYIPAAYKEEWARAGGGNAEVQAVVLDKARQLVGELHRAGVELIAGTDVVKPFFVPGFNLHDELSLFVRAGRSEMEAIEAATRRPARLVGLTDCGTIETGMLADLVLLGREPSRKYR